jgi:predicted RNA-binding protein YlqC (UPF0109 family)
MSEIDQQFIEYVVKSLVGKPDAVHVDRRIDEKGVLLELTVDPEDLGRVIGKRGATAQSLRTLLRALGTKNDARYNLKIIDNGVEGDHHSAPAPAPASSTPSSSDDSDSSDAVDDTPDDTAVAPAVVEEDDQTDEPHEEDQASERLRQAREELADLDDIDV